jgi:hypothetical protein
MREPTGRTGNPEVVGAALEQFEQDRAGRDQEQKVLRALLPPRENCG